MPDYLSAWHGIVQVHIVLQMDVEVPIVAEAEFVVTCLLLDEPEEQQSQIVEKEAEEMRESPPETLPRKKRQLEAASRPQSVSDAARYPEEEEAAEAAAATEPREELPSPGKRRAVDPSWALATPLGLSDSVPAE